jgi:hypothetical protein
MKVESRKRLVVSRLKLILKRIAIITLTFSLPSIHQAQTQVLESNEKMPASLGLNFGSKGIVGLDLAFEISPKINLRFGFNYLNVSISGYDVYMEQFDTYLTAAAKIKQTNFEAIAQFALFKNKWRHVKLEGGFGYFFLNQLHGRIQLRDTYPWQQIELTPEEIGYGEGEFSFKSPVSPYLGITIGNIIPKKRISASIQLGTFYKGKPQVEINATNLVRHNDSNEEVIEKGLSSYRWWPVISFRLAHRI